MLGERAEAEDVLAEVYTQVWRRAGLYDPERGSAGLWLYTITRSRAIDRLRSRGVHGEERLEELDELIAGDPTPREAAETQERAARIRRALLSLPDEQRRAVVASFFLGQTHTEIARRSGEPLGTVKSRIRAGLVRLRDALARRTPAPAHSADPATDRNGDA
jgi:RNA polymerase sigma-70 factor (ECF subfamily)